MIASFFQRLDETGVEYLLISGQATILYGAATFSEDVDIWILSSETNVGRFVSVLRAEGARYYKLTPPLTRENLERGHGFHFVLPGGSSGDVYLDVMGKPPRVGTFESAAANARLFDTDFGRVRTIGPKELVELKKTQRPEDYPVIGRLALTVLAESRETTSPDLRWVLDHCFGLAEATSALRTHAAHALSIRPPLDEPLQRAAREMLDTGELSPGVEDDLEKLLETRSRQLRREDRQYWVSIIDELRALRRAGKLMTEGSLV